MESFARASGDGWRYSLAYRTKKIDGWWIVQRWNGEGWVQVCGNAATYAEARQAATDDSERRAAA